MTELLATSKARDQFAEIINRVACGKERVILTRRGKELVAVVPIEDVRLLESLEDQWDLEDARAAIAEAPKDDTISWEESKARRKSQRPAE